VFGFLSEPLPNISFEPIRHRHRAVHGTVFGSLSDPVPNNSAGALFTVTVPSTKPCTVSYRNVCCDGSGRGAWVAPAIATSATPPMLGIIPRCCTAIAAGSFTACAESLYRGHNRGHTVS
jgi:hypothetical protein